MRYWSRITHSGGHIGGISGRRLPIRNGPEGLHRLINSDYRRRIRCRRKLCSLCCSSPCTIPEPSRMEDFHLSIVKERSSGSAMP